jgi:preprotein translocase SecE subunit
MKKAFAFLADVRREMGHVVWPKKAEIILTLILVVIVGAILAVILMAMDSIVLLALNQIMGGGNG